MSQPWNALLQTAILGTERAPLKVETISDALSELLQKILTDDDAALSLLRCAGATALYDAAGTKPATTTMAAVAPCSLDDQPELNSAAILRLQRMMGEHRFHPLLDEWMSAVAERGLRLRESSLPLALSFATNHQALREKLSLLIGQRGRWLAAQNPDWHWAAEIRQPAQDAIWEEGSRGQRLTFLKQLRQHNPAHARELVQSAWATADPQERASFLALFTSGLSLADEALLENALDDKRKEVRTQAAELLACLPESAYAQRMIERARGLLQLKTKGKDAGQLEIKLPADCDREMQRDGFVKSGKQISADDRQAWLKTLCAAIPPAAWRALLNVSNDDWLKAIPKGRAGNALLEGLAEGGIRYPKEDWLAALIPFLIEREAIANLPELFGGLNKPAQEALVGEWFEHSALFDHDDPRCVILISAGADWSEAFSRKIITVLPTYLTKQQKKKHYWWQNYFGALPQCLAPTVYKFAIQVLMPFLQADHESAPALKNLLDVLEFRYEMLKEIA